MVTLGWDAAGGYTWMTFGFMLLVGFGEGNWGGIGPLLNEVFPTRVRASALGIIYNVSRGVQFLAPVAIAWVASRSTFGAGIALAAPFAAAGRPDRLGAAGNERRAPHAAIRGARPRWRSWARHHSIELDAVIDRRGAL